jgi:hypothetical protein
MSRPRTLGSRDPRIIIVTRLDNDLGSSRPEKLMLYLLKGNELVVSLRRIAQESREFLA